MPHAEGAEEKQDGPSPTVDVPDQEHLPKTAGESDLQAGAEGCRRADRERRREVQRASGIGRGRGWSPVGNMGRSRLGTANLIWDSQVRASLLGASSYVMPSKWAGACFSTEPRMRY